MKGEKMSDDLISRERLKKHYAWWANGSEEYQHFKEVFDTIINLQPTVDAVEVVRCEKCYFAIPYNEKWLLPKKNDCMWCKRYEDVRPLDWFCPDGERRTEDVPRVSDASPTEHLVRCKDCEHYKPSEADPNRKVCWRKDVDGFPVCYDFYPTDFCSYGERRDDG